MDPKSNGRVSAVCFLYIMLTNTMPTIIGSILVVTIKPGIVMQVKRTKIRKTYKHVIKNGSSYTSINFLIR